MKKVLILILLLFTVVLTGCFKNNVVPNEGIIRLYLEEDFTKHMQYEEVPSFDFTFNGTIYTITHVPETFYTLFASNDDVLLSAEISSLIERYRDRTEFVIEEEKSERTTRINTLGSDGKQISHHYIVDDGKVYEEVAFISLPNGLKLTIDYRRFVSEGKTYYVWSYTNNLSMHLYYPLMVIEEAGAKELILLALPNRIKFQVSPNLKVDNILKKDEYLKKEKYSFAYLESLASVKEKKEHVKNYYVTEHNGYEQDGHFYFTYLGIEFRVEFFNEHFEVFYVRKLID